MGGQGLVVDEGKRGAAPQDDAGRHLEVERVERRGHATTVGNDALGDLDDGRHWDSPALLRPATWWRTRSVWPWGAPIAATGPWQVNDTRAQLRKPYSLSGLVNQKDL